MTLAHPRVRLRTQPRFDSNTTSLVLWNAPRVIMRLTALVRRLFTATLRICLGLLLGLVIAEGVFRLRDDGAFPHVNLYLPDAELGAKLEPFATQQLAFTGNPATSLRINSRGFRGPEWPPPSPGELIVVGDSQVFGLGVEEGDTLPSQLASASGRQVINAGVPTYGPFEYLAVARRLLAERPGAKVVFVFNVANDFFELERPNVKRHAVWDGGPCAARTTPAACATFQAAAGCSPSHTSYSRSASCSSSDSRCVETPRHSPSSTGAIGAP